MWAHLCWMAWKLPIGRPNCSRTLAYSTDISRTFCAPPHISAQSPTLPRSATRSRSFQPWPGGPSTPSAATSCSKIGRAQSELQSLAYLVCRLLLEKKNHQEPTPPLECGRPCRGGRNRRDDDPAGGRGVWHL